MEFLNKWWGVNQEISPAELAARAFVMFVMALIMVRISGMRFNGKGEPFDTIIVFLVGGILSRGVVGATPFFSAVAGGATVFAVHVALARMSLWSRKVELLSKGTSIVLFRDNQFLTRNMIRARITKEDICEELRSSCNTNSFDIIEEVIMERTGQLSFIQKDNAGE